MEANELRIGNIICSLGQRHENGRMLEWINYEIPVDLEVLQNIISKNTDFEYSPIPLTEEWLLKFGFVKGKGAFFIEVLKTEFYFRDSYTGGYYWGFISNSDWNMCELTDVRPVNYVHQLQNLYFALTGEELTINERTEK